jgi:hypothetical protein
MKIELIMPDKLSQVIQAKKDCSCQHMTVVCGRCFSTGDSNYNVIKRCPDVERYGRKVADFLQHCKDIQNKKK